MRPRAFDVGNISSKVVVEPSRISHIAADAHPRYAPPLGYERGEISNLSIFTLKAKSKKHAW